MVNALTAFGLAIGWMDIVGVLCFELVMYYIMRQRRSAVKADLPALEIQPVEDQKPRNPLPNLLSRQRMMETENAWIFWGYLLMLNMWIVVSLLMIAGIIMHKPELMTIYLSWCFCGLVIDVLMIFWWIFEMFVGDTIVAMTNILISLLTFAVELAFVLVIYAIYLNLSWSPDAVNTKVTAYFHWLLLE